MMSLRASFMKIALMVFAVVVLSGGVHFVMNHSASLAMNDQELHAFMQSNIPVGADRDKVRAFLESCKWTEGKIYPDHAHEPPAPDFEVYYKPGNKKTLFETSFVRVEIYLGKDARVVEIKVRRIYTGI